MNIGVTLLFRELGISEIKGVLKSTILNCNTENILLKIDKLVLKIEKHYNYKYLGINDIFFVSGKVKEGEILGRTTFFNLNSIKKSNTLLLNKLNSNKDYSLKTFKLSLIYFCENDKYKFTISIVTIINSTISEVFSKIEVLANDKDFIKKIKKHSFEKIKNVKFIGLEDVIDIDLKYNVFETYYREFESVKSLNTELLSSKKISEILKSIM